MGFGTAREEEGRMIIYLRWLRGRIFNPGGGIVLDKFWILRVVLLAILGPDIPPHPSAANSSIAPFPGCVYVHADMINRI
jgi:hypothetical protein